MIVLNLYSIFVANYIKNYGNVLNKDQQNSGLVMRDYIKEYFKDMLELCYQNNSLPCVYTKEYIVAFKSYDEKKKTFNVLIKFIFLKKSVFDPLVDEASIKFHFLRTADKLMCGHFEECFFAHKSSLLPLEA